MIQIMQLKGYLCDFADHGFSSTRTTNSARRPRRSWGHRPILQLQFTASSRTLSHTFVLLFSDEDLQHHIHSIMIVTSYQNRAVVIITLRKEEFVRTPSQRKIGFEGKQEEALS